MRLRGPSKSDVTHVSSIGHRDTRREDDVFQTAGVDAARACREHTLEVTEDTEVAGTAAR